MSIGDILAIVLGVIALIMGVSWVTIKTKADRIFSQAKELKADYDAAVVDGTITDAEKVQIAEHVINIIGDATDIWQMLENFIRGAAKIVKK